MYSNPHSQIYLPCGEQDFAERSTECHICDPLWLASETILGLYIQCDIIHTYVCMRAYSACSAWLIVM